MASASRLPRRLASTSLAVALAASALGALPASAAVLVTPDGCSTVELTSPSPLVVHVMVAGCGDPADGVGVVADLTQDSTTGSVKSWGSPSAVLGTWIDENLNVPAQGGYTLTIRAGLAEVVSTYHVAVLGGVAVTVSHPELRFRPGSMTGSSWPAVVKWSNTSINATFGYRIRVSVDGVWGAWKSTIKDDYNLRVSPGHDYQFQVRGLNLAKVAGPPMASIVYRPRGYSEASSKITYSGGWRTSFDSRFWGNRAKFAKATGATARFTFTGAAAAIVAPLGPTRGSFKVYADGFYQRTVKTYSSSTGYKYVVYAIAWPEDGLHTVTIRVKGTAGHPRVDLDGILTLE